MTEFQLDEIARAVGFPLPDAYRGVARDVLPRRPGGSRPCWFYDDPARVVDETLAPLGDSDYDGRGWRDGYLTIGASPAGDPCILDTQADGLPVLLLSHETHQIEPAWPTLAAFVEEWTRFPDEVDAIHVEEQNALRAWWRRAWVIVGIIVLFAFVIPLIVFWIASS